MYLLAEDLGYFDETCTFPGETRFVYGNGLAVGAHLVRAGCLLLLPMEASDAVALR